MYFGVCYIAVLQLSDRFDCLASLHVVVYLGTSVLFSCITDVIIGWEQNVTRVNESQSILELCVRVMNIDDDVAFPEGFTVSLAANTIRGTAAGELSQEFA